MKQVGFFRALFGVCAGTEIFRELRGNSWLRVILHGALLTLILSIAISCGEMHRLSPRLRRIESRFIEEFGDKWNYSAEGLLPERAPDVARTLAPEPGVLIAYTGNRNEIDLTRQELASAGRGLIVISPRFFAFACRYNGEMIGHWQSDRTAGSLRCRDSEFNATVGPLLRRAAEAPTEEHPAVKVKISDFAAAARNIFAVSLSLWWWCSLILLVFLYTGICVAVNWIFGGARRMPITLREYWKIGVYAGFPAMLVAAAFPAFDLPFLTYPTVYMIGLMLYWMIAANRVFRQVLAESADRPPTDEENTK